MGVRYWTLRFLVRSIPDYLVSDCHIQYMFDSWLNNFFLFKIKIKGAMGNYLFLVCQKVNPGWQQQRLCGRITLVRIWLAAAAAKDKSTHMVVKKFRYKKFRYKIQQLKDIHNWIWTAEHRGQQQKKYKHKQNWSIQKYERQVLHLECRAWWQPAEASDKRSHMVVKSLV